MKKDKLIKAAAGLIIADAADQIALADLESMPFTKPGLSLPELGESLRMSPDDLSDIRDMMKLDGIPESFYDILLNSQGKNDIYRNFENIESLLGMGYEAADICKGAGITVGYFDRCLKLKALHKDLAGAYQEGKIKRTILELAAKLPQASQIKIVQTLKDNGRIVWDDIHAVKRERTAEAAAAMPSFLFNTPGAGSLEAPKDWRADAKASLKEIRDSLPNEAAGARAYLTAAIKALSPKAKPKKAKA